MGEGVRSELLPHGHAHFKIIRKEPEKPVVLAQGRLRQGA